MKPSSIITARAVDSPPLSDRAFASDAVASTRSLSLEWLLIAARRSTNASDLSSMARSAESAIHSAARKSAPFMQSNAVRTSGVTKMPSALSGSSQFIQWRCRRSALLVCAWQLVTTCVFPNKRYDTYKPWSTAAEGPANIQSGCNRARARTLYCSLSVGDSSSHKSGNA